ncbi:MAG: YicC family protein [Candidatus Omnitrophica bacterium]|nr:YicC family protein [Candidatus Omnitrophota bacterium]
MIRSMTGFGSGKAKSPYGSVTAEIKTVNHKFLEISYKLPNGLAFFEDKVKETLQEKIKRGKVYFNLIYEGNTPHGESLFLDLALAKQYYKKIVELKKAFHIEEKIGLKDLVSFPGVLNYRVSEGEFSKLWPLVEKAVCSALRRLITDREREGRHLAVDLKKRIDKISAHIKIIKKKSSANVKVYKKKLEQRIREITGLPPVNSDRLEMEVALYAKNSDITEELTRMESHGINFDRIIKENGETGKKLDFVAQEMHREINTIGSKSSDYAISRSVIEIKSEVEKIREQVKNLE